MLDRQTVDGDVADIVAIERVVLGAAATTIKDSPGVPQESIAILGRNGFAVCTRLDIESCPSWIGINCGLYRRILLASTNFYRCHS